MATIRDIAARVGVSTATVSRVLNNHPSVNEDTRYAVLKVAEELGYATENLRTTKPQFTRTVLVLTHEDRGFFEPTLSNTPEFERTVWGGVHSVLEADGIATRFQQSRMTIEDAQLYTNDVSVSGLVLLGGIIPDEFVGHLISTGLPFVVSGARLHNRHVNAVMADVMQGIQQSITHLIATGRQRIALVNGPQATTTSEEKYHALRLSLTLHERPFDPRMVVESAFGAEDGYRQTLHLLEQAPDVDAILYAEDTIALGGMRALRETGRTIPDDVAVVGFGNYDIANFTDPALTSVDFDIRQMGRIAAHRLTMLLDNPEHDDWLVRVPTNLVLRESA